MGSAVPDHALPSLSGESVSFRDVGPQPTVVFFWASWCGPCRLQATDLAEFQAANPDVHIISIAWADSEAELREAVVSLGIRYVVLPDPAQVEAQGWGVRVYPTTFVLDGVQIVRTVHEGVATSAWIAARVEELAEGVSP